MLATLPLIPVFGALVGLATRDRAEQQWRAMSSLSGLLPRRDARPAHAGRLPPGGGPDLPDPRGHRALPQGQPGDPAHRLRQLGRARDWSPPCPSPWSRSPSASASPAATSACSTALVVLLLAPEAYWPLRRVGAEFHAAAEGVATFETVDALLSRPDDRPCTAPGGDRRPRGRRRHRHLPGPDRARRSTRCRPGPAAPASPLSPAPPAAASRPCSRCWPGCALPTAAVLTVDGVARSAVRPGAPGSHCFPSGRSSSPAASPTTSGWARPTPTTPRSGTCSAGWRSRSGSAQLPAGPRHPARRGRRHALGRRARPPRPGPDRAQRPALGAPRRTDRPPRRAHRARRRRHPGRALARPGGGRGRPPRRPGRPRRPRRPPAPPRPCRLPEDERPVAAALTASPVAAAHPRRPSYPQHPAGSCRPCSAASPRPRASPSPPPRAGSSCRPRARPAVLTLLVAIVAVRTFGLARPVLRYAERLLSHDSALRLLARRRAEVYDALVPLTPGPARPASGRRPGLGRRRRRQRPRPRAARAGCRCAAWSSSPSLASVVTGLLDPAVGLVVGRPLPAGPGSPTPWCAPPRPAAERGSWSPRAPTSPSASSRPRRSPTSW